MQGMGMTTRARGVSPELRGSYDACRRMHRRHDPTFYYATRRLTPEVRPAVHALYAFVRRADELVDGPRRASDADTRRASLDALERDLWRGLEGGASQDPAITALADAGARLQLPLDELSTYMESMRVDCDRVRIESREELDRYMNGSAAAVGRILAPLMGAPAEASESFATLGRAFQLTNFIRDVREDFTLDRIYLPRQERDRFGVGEEQFERREATPGFRALMALEVDRARRLFVRGSAALESVDPRLRPGMRMARGVYLGVLDRVERLGFDVLGRRAGLPPWEMGRAALGSLRR
jgi:15-cis-phytoene synthase